MMNEHYMSRALELAARGRGTASPNPMVGAVVVRDGTVVGEGWHVRPGQPHAEVLALRAAGELARGADLYVTLEPCAHQGRTPACTDAIIGAGISRVFTAMVDPNPLVNGAGIEKLRAARILVETGLMEEAARRLNEAYFRWITAGVPFVTLKMALSLDGKAATRTGDSRWISNEEARRLAHEWRAACDAVMVGVGTILTDDPLLTARLPGYAGRQPLRVIVDSSLRTPLGCRMLRETPDIPVIVATNPGALPRHAEALRKAGAEVLRVPGCGPRVDLAALLGELGRREITSVLLEGGAGLFTSVLEQGLADKVAAFIAPLIIGGTKAPSPFQGRGADTMADALRLGDVTLTVLGDNVLVEGYPGKPAQARPASPLPGEE